MLCVWVSFHRVNGGTATKCRDRLLRWWSAVCSIGRHTTIPKWEQRRQRRRHTQNKNNNKKKTFSFFLFSSSSSSFSSFFFKTQKHTLFCKSACGARKLSNIQSTNQNQICVRLWNFLLSFFSAVRLFVHRLLLLYPLIWHLFNEKKSARDERDGCDAKEGTQR